MKTKDMYQTMFHLEDAESIELAARYDEEGERKIKKKKFSFQDSIISDFFDAVCNEEFSFTLIAKYVKKS